jgi:hypothetical protein
MGKLVSNDMVQNALTYLAESSEAVAAAKAERIRAEYNRKKTRARIMLDTDGPVAIREAQAECSEEYFHATEREAEAVRADEWHRAQRNKCEAIIEAWRTENANVRAAERVR